MTFAALRALHAIIGDAIDDIEHVYAHASSERARILPCTHLSPAGPPKIGDRGGYQNTIFPLMESSAYASPPPSPHVIAPDGYGLPDAHVRASYLAHDPHMLDFPSLDAPYDPNSPSELLSADPIVVRATNHIIAAAGQLTATVQAPFLSICDASMAYHLPSCIRLFEASHTVEILREAGIDGLHVSFISRQNRVEETKLAHALRLLATHHIVREVAPDVFALNRISSLIDSGKSLEELRNLEQMGRPELKYRDTNGIAAFTGMCTDEIHKSSAYLTEAYLLSPSKHGREAREPTSAPFCFAFNTLENKVGFFNWLEGEANTVTKGKTKSDLSRLLGSSIESQCGPGEVVRPALGLTNGTKRHMACTSSGRTSSYRPTDSIPDENPNRFRLERFGKAMTGTGSWEAPGAIFNGFDWHSLPKNSTIVDVGGGIGSTSMLLASAFSEGDGNLGLKFIVQDRPVVVDMGEKAWKTQCPKLLENGVVKFQVHDFFTPQPVRNAAIFLLRVVLHDWPDDFARQILLQLRYAASENTKLLIADFVLPLACHETLGSDNHTESEVENIEGAKNSPVPFPLLANLGKASTMVYWMDLTMQVAFNAQERTLKEIATLARSAGWTVIRVTKAEGSHFGHITALPAKVPPGENDVTSRNTVNICGGDRESVTVQIPPEMGRTQCEIAGRAISRCGTPTFGSSTALPSFEEAIAKFGGRASKSRRLPALPARWTSKAINAVAPAASNSSSAPKKKPSPLSVQPLSLAPPSSANKNVISPRPPQASPVPPKRQPSQSNIQFQREDNEAPSAKQIIMRLQSPSPHQSNCTSNTQIVLKSTPSPSRRVIARRSSHAQLYKPSLSPIPPLPSSIPVRVMQDPTSPVGPSAAPAGRKIPTSKSTAIRRRASCANLTQPSRKRAESDLVPPLPNTPTGADRGTCGGLLSGRRGAKLQFDKMKHDDDLEQSPVKVSVLAAAAKIEKGLRVEHFP
ncbi:hypothetical protein AX15_000751 [Amanita polypyramis BW_CC]|nr:hypothetical protein AX15_000751 [Amanita polypyramis BW_CC]